MTITVLQGTKIAENFILGEGGVLFGSSDASDGDERNTQDDSVILDLDPILDTISLPGTKYDYLIRPTSLPYDVDVYPKYTTLALDIFLTDRNQRFIIDEGNEITSIGFLVYPKSRPHINLEEWTKSLGLALDVDLNSKTKQGNYYTDVSGSVFKFDGSSALMRSSLPGKISKSESNASFSILPSKSILDEGESISMAISSGVTSPGNTIYYKISGNNVDKKDFSLGSISGSIRMSTSGTSTLPLTLSLDKKTEGAEFFKVSVYSDKKMKNILAESSSLEIVDSSPANKDTRRNSSKELFVKDPLTGVTVRSDVVQTGGWNYIPKSEGLYELELSTKNIVYTEKHFDYPGDTTNRSDISRLVLDGQYSYKNGIASGKTSRVSLYTIESVNGSIRETAQSSLLSKSPRNPLDIISFSGLQGVTTDYAFNRVLGGIDRTQLQGLAHAAFYPQNWWTNPFDTNLI